MSDEARLVLASTGIHPERSLALRHTYGAAEAVRRLASGALSASERVRSAAATSASHIATQLAAAEVSVLFRGGPGYPVSLERFPDSPDVLFARGELPTAPAVGIVGTRRCTRYGHNLAGAMAAAVGNAGWVTVSGLARGIDSAAHHGTVESGGQGIAVLGSGPDVWYPAEHRSLGLELAADGAVITEYPLGTPPEPWRFPVRNRIISGLSEAVVIVEAAVTGGALITARLAMEQGHPVFAVPGDVDRASSEGCNLLIRDGAHPVLGAADLIEELSLVMGRPPRVAVSEGGGPILEAIGDTGARADELARTLDVDIATVLSDLARLEASATVRRHGDTYVWSRGKGVAVDSA